MNSLQQELEDIHQSNLYRSLKVVDSEQEAVVIMQGQSVINFSSNNYLGLANHPKLKQAAIEATQKYGTGSGASRLITGSMKLHHALEERLAQFKGTEAALVFNSGYHANLGILTSLVGEGDLVFSDELNHASIIDGCRLSRATVKVYRHGDVGNLEKALKDPHLPPGQRGFQKDSPLPRREGARGRVRRVIVTDSLFSMDGDRAPLKEFAELAERYDCWLMVDEAHATGVFGPHGKGLVEEVWPQGVPSFLKERLIQMGTLGKALGSFGAYVAGSRELIELLINKARSFIYTTALPPAVIAASLAALEIVEREPERREKLWENVRYLFSKLSPLLTHLSTSPGPSPSATKSQQTQEWKSPIIPFIIGDSQKALDLSQKLFQLEMVVTAIRTPTVPQGTERLRITLMATHTKKQIDRLCEALEIIYGSPSD